MENVLNCSDELCLSSKSQMLPSKDGEGEAEGASPTVTKEEQI